MKSEKGDTTESSKDNQIAKSQSNSASSSDPQSAPVTTAAARPADPDPPFNYKDTIFNLVLFAAASMVVEYLIKLYLPDPKDSNAKDIIPENPLNVPVSPTDAYLEPESLHSDLKKLILAWDKGTNLDAFLYVSTKENITLDILSGSEAVTPVWSHSGIDFGSSFSFKHQLSIPLTEGARNIETVFGHFMLKKAGSTTSLSNPDFKINNFAIRTEPITKHITYKPEANLKNLLGKDTPSDDQDLNTEGLEPGREYTYFHPNLTIALVEPLPNVIDYSSEPNQSKRWITPLADQSDFMKDGIGGFLPIIYYNNFWQLSEDMYRPNNTAQSVNINFEFSSMSILKFYLYCSFDASFSSAPQGSVGISNGVDLIKKTLIGTNPYLLALTFLVSVLHSVFDFLAFKNDVQFWNKKKDAVGVSVRTMLLELSFEVIIFLYLLENNNDTSMVIIISSLISLVINIWKIYKALDLKLELKPPVVLSRPSSSKNSENSQSALITPENNPLSGRKVILEMNHKVITIRNTNSYSKLESDSAEYDKVAFQYLAWAAYPLLIMYAIYSLYTSKFKSWYSFIISVLVGYVYTFGFISMTPQLYINYKLKSVAHMPIKSFIYKALNTFIDDLFAFVMPMPTLHRIATLRDDVVFFIYLYQRHIYRVDHKRPNEFGQVGESSDQKEE
ncbi:Cleft lip and palate transmembrane protein 1-like protein [Smittium mucronatum]|uniref:Cleft lip and palate transmembrane protein 1-like protein n=1 Tax=Smittium mucronatum TaxID=133383 RepID=A0A1R0GR98_9FUNG|nr:Cleft lip and palate transmembrane protein 1-like protein [Smittium mucronatum]